MPGIPLRLTPVLPLAAISMVALACQSREPRVAADDAPAVIPACPEFVIPGLPLIITVPPEGDSIAIGDSSFIRFAAGAVQQESQYQISYGPTEQGRRTASIQIDPIDGARSTFTEPVLLHISYYQCRDIKASPRRKFMLRVPATGQPERLNGAMSQTRNFVEAFLSDFSGFAIAI